MHNFKNLKIWSEGKDLSIDIYNVVATFHKAEMYGHSSQLKRAIVSVSSNIAEGAGRKSIKEFIQYSHIAIGSLCEVETQLIISQRFGYIEKGLFNQLIIRLTDLRKMIFGFVSKI